MLQLAQKEGRKKERNRLFYKERRRYYKTKRGKIEREGSRSYRDIWKKMSA